MALGSGAAGPGVCCTTDLADVTAYHHETPPQHDVLDRRGRVVRPGICRGPESVRARDL